MAAPAACASLPHTHSIRTANGRSEYAAIACCNVAAVATATAAAALSPRGGGAYATGSTNGLYIYMMDTGPLVSFTHRPGWQLRGTQQQHICARKGMSGSNSKVLADIEMCVQKIASVLGTLESCVRALSTSAPSSSRIHREEPPIIPPELASSLSRASSKYGFEFGSRLSKRESSIQEALDREQNREEREDGAGEAETSVSRSRPQPPYVDWASNLSGLSRASKGGKGVPGGPY